MRSSLCCLALLLNLSALSQVMSQDKQASAEPAVNVETQIDADFSLQGEYAGWTNQRGTGSEYLGLQVIALGDGKFDAVVFQGGLPGAGWNGTAKQKHSGAREGERVRLTGESRVIILTQGIATLSDSQGNELGRLGKVRRVSPTLGAIPPRHSVVLFDGKSTDQFTGGKLAADGSLLAGVLTKMPVQNFQLHLEFRTPYMPHARGQGRGNSGVYIQQRYEVQILDSFGLEGVENECGGLYKQQRPDTNMCFPPLFWQTYDIWFSAAKFSADGKTKLSNARITVLHNGIPIHQNRQVVAKTGGGKVEGPETLPINLQDHGNPVTFRNIWLVEGEGASPVSPMTPSAACRRRWLFRRCR